MNKSIGFNQSVEPKECNWCEKVMTKKRIAGIPVCSKCEKKALKEFERQHKEDVSWYEGVRI